MRGTAGSEAAPAARCRNRRRGSFIAPASFLIMARINSSVWLARPIKKQLHLSEQPHPILLHHDKMCRLADLDEPLVRALGSLWKTDCAPWLGVTRSHSAAITSVGILIRPGS